MARYKDARMNGMFDLVMARAKQPRSSLYKIDGSANRGTPTNDAFWNGYSGHKRSGGKPYYERGTLAHAAYMAGREYRKIDTEVVKL